MLNIKNKIVKNYINFLANYDIKFINNIIKIINNNNYFQIGGDFNNNKNLKKINFIIINIDLLIKDIEMFNKIMKIINKHDLLMSKINVNYQKFNYNENILDYLEKIYKAEFIFI